MIVSDLKAEFKVDFDLVDVIIGCVTHNNCLHWICIKYSCEGPLECFNQMHMFALMFTRINLMMLMNELVNFFYSPS